MLQAGGDLERPSLLSILGTRSNSVALPQVWKRRSTWQIRGSKGVVFVDAECMKERVRAVLRVEHKAYYKDSGAFQKVARSAWFEYVCLAVIAFNLVWIAVDTDNNRAIIPSRVPAVFLVADNLFCAFYVLEWFIRFMAFRSAHDCYRDRWFVFNTVIAFLTVVETWVLPIVISLSNISDNGMLGASLLRIARFLQLLRVARMARLLNFFPDLMILIKGMAKAVYSVFLTTTLLVSVTYIFSILFRQLTAERDVGNMHFQSVPGSMYTLMLHGCLLDDVKEFSDTLWQESLLLVVIFFVFVWIAALTVMNMLIGVLCEVVSSSASSEQEEQLMQCVRGKVRKIVEQVDEDSDRNISKAELAEILGDKKACQALRDVGVDVVGLIDFADALFVGDDGKPVETLSFSDFMDAILELRGSNTARFKDIMDLRKLIRNTALEVTSQVEYVKEIHKDLRGLVAGMCKSGLWSRRDTDAPFRDTPLSLVRSPSDLSCSPVTASTSTSLGRPFSVRQRLGTSPPADRAEATTNEALGLRGPWHPCVPEGEPKRDRLLPRGDTRESTDSAAVPAKQFAHPRVSEIMARYDRLLPRGDTLESTDSAAVPAKQFAHPPAEPSSLLFHGDAQARGAHGSSGSSGPGADPVQVLSIPDWATKVCGRAESR